MRTIETCGQLDGRGKRYQEKVLSSQFPVLSKKRSMWPLLRTENWELRKESKPGEPFQAGLVEDQAQLQWPGKRATLHELG
jgi:hypothetical protein